MLLYDIYGMGIMIWLLLVLGLFIGKYCDGVLSDVWFN